MKPEDCPRFEKCSANFCPLDADRDRRVLHDSERTCRFMLESMKPGAVDRYLGGPMEEVFKTAAAVAAKPELLAGPLRKALKRASKNGRRIVPIKAVSAKPPTQELEAVQ